MSTDSSLNEVKTSIEAAREATSKINEWAEEATRLAKEGKELSEIQGVLKGVTAFGKASAVLSVAAGGIELVLALVGGPSPEEQIMNMISELSDKVDRLWTHLDNEFERLQAHGDLVNAKDLMLKHRDAIKTFKIHIDDYRNAKTEQDQKAFKLVLLNNIYFQSKLEDHVNLMADLLKTTKPDENVLLATYNTTHGDLKAITTVGMSLLMSAVYASMAYGLLAALRYQADAKNVLPTPEAIAGIFQPKIGAISGAIDLYSSNCWYHAGQNIQERLEKDILEQLDVSNHNKASQDLCGQLSGQWYWYDWLVLVYDPVVGYGAHGVTGGRNRIDKFRHPCMNGAKANIVISWTPKSAPPLTGVEVSQVAAMVKKVTEDQFRQESSMYSRLMGISIGTTIGMMNQPFSPPGSAQSYLNAFRTVNLGSSLLWLIALSSFHGSEKAWSYCASNESRVHLGESPLELDQSTMTPMELAYLHQLKPSWLSWHWVVMRQ